MGRAMLTVNVHEAKTQLSKLLDAAERGEAVVIARAGKPVAKLVVLTARPRRLGQLAGRCTVPDDFDAPLPADVPAAFEAPGGA